MDSSIKEQLWFLYCRHVEQLEHDARNVRETFGFKGTDLVKVAQLTRPEFEEFLLDVRGERETRVEWLERIIEIEGDEERRKSLRIALDLEAATSSVRRPHFLQKQDQGCKEPLE